MYYTFYSREISEVLKLFNTHCRFEFPKEEQPEQLHDNAQPRRLGDFPTACNAVSTRMRANAQRDGRPAEYRWRPLFNAAEFG